MDTIQKSLLEKLTDLHDIPEGAYNIRANGSLGARNTTANIDIVSKTDKDGIEFWWCEECGSAFDDNGNEIYPDEDEEGEE